MTTALPHRPEWIAEYLHGEGFSQKHLEAICAIVMAFNANSTAEKEVFAFAEHVERTHLEWWRTAKDKEG